MAQREPRRGRHVLVRLLLAVLALTAACSAPDPAASPGPGTYVVSYAGAASRLDALDPLEHDDQVLDWARLGLADAIGLDPTARLAALYDTTPLRDPGFDGLVDQPTGPGRALFDGRDTLHLLVPEDDPARTRTIGTLLDEHVADHGTDPVTVAVHRYRIRSDDRTVVLTAEEPVGASELRTQNGWLALRVDTPDGLAEFLGRSTRLARLELRGAEIWAQGWEWPEALGARLTPEDVTVLQRAYRLPAIPGFSLDPGPPLTPDDLAALLPDLDPALAAQVAAGQGGGLVDAVEAALFQPERATPVVGLPTDRVQLWALRTVLAGGSPYSQARYDGGLAGTEVGMSLFYADLIAKDWTSGVGTGVPADAVPGFVAGATAGIPLSLCSRPGDPTVESGRLWFGQNEGALRADDDRFVLGAQATRLFSRADGAAGTEVEPSFALGRSLSFWDRHFDPVADYEPQYRRLEAIQRWSGALEWLTTRGPADLPQVPDVRTDLTFTDWYAARGELRERGPVAFVTPPSATEEALLPTPSATAPICGNGLLINGGVSLADTLNRLGGRVPVASVPPAFDRAGPREGAIDAAGQGTVTDLRAQSTDTVTRTIEGTTVRTTGGPRAYSTLSGARNVTPADNRELVVRSTADDGGITWEVDFGGDPVGILESSPLDRRTTLYFRSGAVHDMGTVGREYVAPARGPPSSPAVLYVLEGAPPELGTVVRVRDGRLVSITEQPRVADGRLTLVHGLPGPPDVPTGFVETTLLDGPPPALSVAFEVRPATADRAATLTPTELPAAPDSVIRVELADGAAGEILVTAGRFYVRADDPALGPNGAAEGAAVLRDLTAVLATQVLAVDAPGLIVVELGDAAVAFVGPDTVTVLPRTDAGAQRVELARDPARPDATLYVRFEDGRVLIVDTATLTEATAGERSELGAVRASPVPTYADEGLGALLATEPVSTIPDSTPVLVRTMIRDTPSRAALAPDIVFHLGRDWRLILWAGGVPGPGRAAATAAPAPAPPGDILLLVSLCEPDQPEEAC